MKEMQAKQNNAPEFSQNSLPTSQKSRNNDNR